MSICIKSLWEIFDGKYNPIPFIPCFTATLINLLGYENAVKYSNLLKSRIIYNLKKKDQNLII